MWALHVGRALDDAAALEAAAAVAGFYDPKVAAGMLARAESLRQSGTAEAGPGAGLPGREQAVAEWESAYGSMDDPAVREKVYSAVAALRKLDAEEAEKQARNAAARQSASARINRRQRRR